LPEKILKTPSQKQISFIVKPFVFLLCLVPFLLLVLNAINDNLGTNPVETLTHETGLWALRFLLITLMVTPLRRLTNAHWLIKLRRMFGLYTFFYAFLHFITYIWLDQFFDWKEILIDIPKRPFITIGFISFVLLIPLAVTSTSAMQRRLKKKWLVLHKTVYIIPVLVIIHFIWSLKADYTEPFYYALIFSVLMLNRLYYRKKKPISDKLRGFLVFRSE